MARDNRRNRPRTDEQDDTERITGREIGFVPFDPAEATLEQFRAKIGQEGTIVKIYRRTTGGMQYCFQGIPSEIDEEMIRLYHAKQVYAGENGQYYARAFRNGEPFGDSIPISIAPQVGVPAAPGDPHGGMATNGNGGGRLEVALDRILQRLEAVERQEKEPLSSLADAMVKLQSLNKPQESNIDQILKCIEIGKTLGGGGAVDTDDWKPLIKEALAGLGPVIGAVAQSYMQKGAAPGHVAAGGEPVQILNDKQRLFAGIQFLKAKCLKGSDPGLYVDLIMSERDEPDNQKLIHAVTTMEFAEFVEIDQEIGRPPYNAWFEFVYDRLRSGAEELNKMALDTGGESGDKGDAGGDGKARKKGGHKP